ncbi:hypothetical protein F750_5605 [Streptomyces sp. PAMC 26508]|nr:hypothetical protein F750_5605 [Streptomyces sp. PAMC 26508]
MHGRPFPAPDDTSPLTLAPARTSPHAELCTSSGVPGQLSCQEGLMGR